MRRRVLSLLLGLPATVLATWYGTHWALYWDHVRRFNGICGPHAPDIPAHPCTYETYIAEFDAGFAGVGLLVIKVVAVVLVVPLFVAAWVGGCWLVDRRSRGASDRAEPPG